MVSSKRKKTIKRFINMIPQFPIFIPSKGRAEKYRRLTSRSLDEINVEYRIVIEPDEYDYYLRHIEKRKLLVMDMSYKEKYDCCDNKNDQIKTGAGAARNFIWDYSINEGFNYHWTMDDNIRTFRRLNKNKKIKVADGSMFRAMEDFCLRYKNISMAGPNYDGFVSSREKQFPFVANRRIYSCNLINNNAPFRWRGRYNEDTILSLDMLKAGWCTVLFNAFVQDKKTTQTIKGGNTDELYDGGGSGKEYSKTGTIEKSKMMITTHPDVSRIVWRHGRVHHHVDYSQFKTNKLIRKEGYIPNRIINEYGFKLRKLTNK